MKKLNAQQQNVVMFAYIFLFLFYIFFLLMPQAKKREAKKNGK